MVHSGSAVLQDLSDYISARCRPIVAEKLVFSIQPLSEVVNELPQPCAVSVGR